MSYIHSPVVLLCLSCLLPLVRVAHAAFAATSSANLAIYWGQNSHDKGTGDLAQQNLAFYCANTEIDIIPVAFLNTINNPSVNFASASDKCTLIPGTELLDCPEIGDDITTCQNIHRKTILLSIGGATYSEGGFASPDQASIAADNVWAMFGPEQSGSTPRPFGSAVIDGFDFDLESVAQHMVGFAKQLRALMDEDEARTGKQWMLTTAPQCPYPDAANGQMLGGEVAFDAVYVQFYNNYCGVQSFEPGAAIQSRFNFDVWDNWAKTISANPEVKVMVGVPGSATAAGTGYQGGTDLTPILAYCKQFSSFGGVMVWDVSQVYANTGFLEAVVSGLAGSGQGPNASATNVPQQPILSPPATSASVPMPTYSVPPPTASVPTTLQTSIIPSLTQSFNILPSIPSPGSESSATPGAVDLVHHWNQCGGKGWNGGTVCMPPYQCIVYSQWYSDCR